MISVLESANNFYCCCNILEENVEKFLNEHKNDILWSKKLKNTNCKLIFQLSTLFDEKNLKFFKIKDRETLSKCLYQGILYFLSKKDLVYTLPPLNLENLKNFDLDVPLKILDSNYSPPFLLVHLSTDVTYYLFTTQECIYLGDSPIGSKFLNKLVKYKNLDFDKILPNSDNATVDLLVSDIYQNYSPTLGLPQRCIASSLQKLPYLTDYSTDDLVKSLILTLAFDITSYAIAYSQLNDVNTIAYCGDILNYESVCKLFHFAAMFRSSNSINSIFFRYSPYIGPLGMSIANFKHN